MQRDTIWSKVTQQIKKTWKRSNTKRPDTPEIPLHNYENAVSNSFPQRIGIETREDEWNRFWWQKERERERERERGGCFEFRHRQVKNGDQRNKCAMSSHCVIALLCANLSHAPPTRVLNNVDTLAWTLFTCRTCMQFSNIFYMNWILRYIYI